MNRVFRIVWNRSLELWTVAPESASGRGRGGRASAARVQGLVGAALLGFAGAAAADCAGTTTIVCSPGVVQAGTVGTGIGTPSGTSITALPGAAIDTGSQTAISVGDGATMLIQSGASVGNTAPGGTNGNYGTGANTIEMNSNNTLTIEQGASVRSKGSAGDAEAINPIGTGNLIINNGLIDSQAGGAAFWFESGSGSNTIVNGATGTINYQSGNGNIIGVSGTMAISFTNLGQVLGSLNFAGGDDTLAIGTGSSISGNIDGGGGANTLKLVGAGSDTFARPFSNFQTLIKDDSGTWTFGNPLAASGITRAEVAGGTLILGADASGYTGSMTVDAGGTLQTSAGFAPLAIADNGLVRFAQPVDASYGGLLSGSGGIEKTGAGMLTLTADQAISGSTTISAGTLRLGDGGTTGSVGGPIVDNAALRIERSNQLTIAAPISGSGSVTQAGSGTTIFSADNSYTGGTTIASGTLQLGNGGSSGSVAGDILDNAVLAIDRSNALTLAGTISGSGRLVQQGSGTTVLTADNSYTGGTTIAGGTLQLGNGGSSGSVAGDILDNATLAVNRADTLQIHGAISGSGALQQIGSGTTVLSGANSYSGTTLVAAGTLRAGAADALSADSAHQVAAGATLDTGGFNQTVAALSNAGTVNLLSQAAGSTLTVTGAYIGNGGVLSLGTVLAGGTSMSDRLVLSGPGASASGSTTLRITNLGGLGGLTSGNGIEVVSAVNGATTTAQTTRSAFTLQNGHVDAGAFEYRLYAADAQGAGENWYLRSQTTVTVDPGQPASPSKPSEPSAPSTPPTRSIAGISVPTYRGEVPLLAALPAQLRQGDLAMLGNLHRRVGDETAPAASAAAGNGQAGVRQAWARAIYNDIDIRQDGPAAAHSKGQVSGVQAGTDLLAAGAWRAGVYVGTLDGHANVDGNAHGLIGPVGGNELQSRFVGAYATWMDKDGLYVDSVLQGARHDYTVQANGNIGLPGRASSGTASVEAGKAFALDERWVIEPQAQLVWQHSSYDNLLLGGALVRQDADAGWIGRLGIRVRGDIPTAAGRLQPYARVNVYKAGAGSDVATFIGPAASTPIASATGYTSTELAAGMTLALGAATTLYGEIGQLYGSGGESTVKSSVQGSIGLRVRW